MKKHLLSLIVALAVAIFFSCTAVMKKIYGIKKPSIESPESLKKDALGFGFDTTYILTSNAEKFLDNFHGKGIPDIDVFDSEGNYIEYRDSDTSCNAGLFKFIPELNTNKIYNKTGKKKLDEELSKFVDLYGKPHQIEKDADFYLMVYWATWTGRLNKDHVAEWEQLVKENKNCKIKYIKVNLDMQTHWPIEEQKRIKKILRS